MVSSDRWPLVELRLCLHTAALLRQAQTVLRLSRLQGSQRRNVPIDHRRIGHRPEPLGRLQFRRVRRQQCQVEALRHDQLPTRMPARLIQHEDDLPCWSRPLSRANSCKATFIACVDTVGNRSQ